MAKTIISPTSNSNEVETVYICGIPVGSKKSAKNIAKILRLNGVTINDLNANSKQIERTFGRPFYVQLLAKLYGTAPHTSCVHKASRNSGNNPQYTCGWFQVQSSKVSSSRSELSLLHSGVKYEQVLPTKLKTVPEKISCVMIGDDIFIDEYWWYKNAKLYEIGSNYIFKVIRSKPYGKSREYILEDRLGHEQSVVSSQKFEDGDSVVCQIRGFSKKYKHLNSLLLTDPRLFEDPKVKEVRKSREYMTPATHYPNGKRPEAWYREVEGLGKHTATSPFKCSCCGRSFYARQGCKIEFREIYFCKACADQIFKKSDNGYLRIVYTPMGNKR